MNRNTETRLKKQKSRLSQEPFHLSCFSHRKPLLGRVLIQNWKNHFIFDCLYKKLYRSCPDLSAILPFAITAISVCIRSHEIPTQRKSSYPIGCSLLVTQTPGLKRSLTPFIPFIWLTGSLIRKTSDHCRMLNE